MSTFTAAVFATPVEARRAVDRLTDQHFEIEEISILTWDRSGPAPGRVSPATLGPRAAIVGAGAGLVLGALVAALLASGVITIAGVFFAASPLALAVKGGVAGAFAGGFIGLLGGLGWWRNRIELPPRRQRVDSVLVGVHSGEDRVSIAEEALRVAGGRLVAP